MKLSRAVTEFLADNRARLAPATLRAYESDLHRLVAMVPIDSVLGLTPELASGYFRWCSMQGQKPATLHRKFASLSEFCRWGLRKKLWTEDPMRDVPKIGKPHRVPRPFTRDEIARLVGLELDPLQRITRDLLAYTGLRVTPICTLRVGDIQFSPHVTQGVVSLGAIRSVGKGNKPHVVPIAPLLYDPLYNYVLQHTDLKPQSWLLRQARSGRPLNRRIVEDWTHAWGERAQVPACLPHRFRHSVATGLLDAGVDIRVIAEILGHADLKDTMLYTKVSNAQVAEAMTRLNWGPAPVAPSVSPGDEPT